MPTHFPLLFEPGPFGAVRTACLCYTWLCSIWQGGHVCPHLVLASVVPLDPRAWGLPCLIWTSLNSRSFFHLDLSSLATQSLWDCLLCSHTQIFCVLPVISGAEDCVWKDPQKPDHGLSWVCMHMLGGQREGEKQSIPKCQCVGRQKMEIHGETTRNWPNGLLTISVDRTKEDWISRACIDLSHWLYLICRLKIL